MRGLLFLDLTFLDFYGGGEQKLKRISVILITCFIAGVSGGTLSLYPKFPLDGEGFSLDISD